MVFAICILINMVSLSTRIETYEKEAIINALRDCKNVMAQAAKQLGITERMISYKIKKYGITIRKGVYGSDKT